MHNSDTATRLIHHCIAAHGIYRDCSTISRMYHRHPMPNSIRSVSDTLDELGVVNYVYYLNSDQLTSIVYPAIAPTTSSFVLITAVSNGNVTVIGEGDKEITVPLKDFTKIWNGYILTVDLSNEQNSNKSASYYLGQLMWHLKEKAIFYLCAFLLVLICSILSFDEFQNALFLISGLAGIAISAVVYLKENKINNPLVGLCNIKGRDRCQEVIGSKGSKILGHISIGDLSLTYFITIIFITILPNYSIGAVSLYPLTSIAFVIYSVIWMLVNKKACPLCITVDLLLIVQAILVASSLAEIEFTRQTFTYAVAFFIVYLALIKLKDLLNSERDLKSLAIYLSARYDDGTDALRDALCELVDIDGAYQGDVVVSNMRHANALNDALRYIHHAKKAIVENLSSELLAEELRRAADSLGEITGRITSDHILQTIFSRFCIGK